VIYHPIENCQTAAAGLALLACVRFWLFSCYFPSTIFLRPFHDFQFLPKGLLINSMVYNQYSCDQFGMCGHDLSGETLHSEQFVVDKCGDGWGIVIVWERLIILIRPPFFYFLVYGFFS
jgi:hypothetical protein